MCHPIALAMLIVLEGCGRLAFDPLDDGGGPGDGARDTGIDALPGVPGAIAWWKLDEGTGLAVTDSIGTVDGMLAGATLPTWTSGMYGGALNFAGGGTQAVLFGTPAALANLPAFTVVGWIRSGAVAADGQAHCLFDKGLSTSGWSVLFFYSGDGDMLFTAYYPTTTLGRVSIPGVIPANTWSHVAASWDGTNNSTGIHLYVGGSEVAYAAGQDATGARSDDAGNTGSIGCTAPTSFVGDIDDVLIYDRVLTPAEVANL